MINFLRRLFGLDTEPERVKRARARWVRAQRDSWTGADD